MLLLSRFPLSLMQVVVSEGRKVRLSKSRDANRYRAPTTQSGTVPLPTHFSLRETRIAPEVDFMHGEYIWWHGRITVWMLKDCFKSFLAHLFLCVVWATASRSSGSGDDSENVGRKPYRYPWRRHNRPQHSILPLAILASEAHHDHRLIFQTTRIRIWLRRRLPRQRLVWHSYSRFRRLFFQRT